MEQIQNQETNTIVIDDGSKEYDIKNHYGENLGSFPFPSGRHKHHFQI